MVRIVDGDDIGRLAGRERAHRLTDDVVELDLAVFDLDAVVLIVEFLGSGSAPAERHGRATRVVRVTSSALAARPKSDTPASASAPIIANLRIAMVLLLCGYP